MEKKNIKKAAAAKTVTAAARPKKKLINGKIVSNKPQDYGMSTFSCIAYNSLQEETPLVIKLAITNDPHLTEYIMNDCVTENKNITGVADEFIYYAINTCRLIANENGDSEVECKLTNLDETYDHFYMYDEADDLVRMENEAQEIGKNPEYTSLMNVLVTALHVGYEF